MFLFGVLIALPLWSLLLAALALVTQALGMAAAASVLSTLAATAGAGFLLLVPLSWAVARTARRRIPA